MRSRPAPRLSLSLTLGALVLLLGVTTSAAAQDSRLVSRFQPATVAALDAILDSAGARQLPTEPLVQRALEGAGRGTDPARVVAGVRALAERMVRAREALGHASSQNELMAGASALYLGIDSAALRRIRLTQPSGDITLPLVVLADIVERGVPRDTATRVIQSLSQAGVPEESYQVLRRSILTDINAGAQPVTAVTARARGILEAQRPPSGVPRP
ncbi:MAG TPA: hypothetical protein VFZ21_29755 [Gemmatimonadaceae bacterium]|jgi:hypothetical protein|nr:hypothetical protein [Gemmatimonadaceae bacterium]